ncbi:MAG: hypothetical protein JW969_14650 [Spirochaetales bacterium]|nr:hypothetical protein [Spirochaetales bacterium]
MRIKVVGAGAVGSLIGGLLSLKGVDICFAGNPDNGERIEYLRKNKLRLILPGKWIKAEDFNTGNPETVDMVFVAVRKSNFSSLKKNDILSAGGDGSKNVILFNSSREDFELPFQAEIEVTECLTLFSAVTLQSGDVELCSENPCIIFPKNRQLKKIFSLLKGFGFRGIQVDDVTPYLNSFFIYQLSWLPVAMCNTTLENFLSYQEGRDLITNILKEGIKTFDRSNRKMARLPIMDPVDLLTGIEKKPEQFMPYRFLPNRAYNSLLQSLLLMRGQESVNANSDLLKLAQSAGVDTVWNWKLVQKLPKVVKYGFFNNPWELLRGIE